jgi:hypothetical protein
MERLFYQTRLRHNYALERTRNCRAGELSPTAIEILLPKEVIFTRENKLHSSILADPTEIAHIQILVQALSKRAYV